MTDISLEMWLALQKRINLQEGLFIMTTQVIVDRLTALDAKLAKIGTETTALLADVDMLKDALAAANVDVAAVDAALAAVEARAAGVDELVADPVVEPPVEPPNPTE